MQLFFYIYTDADSDMLNYVCVYVSSRMGQCVGL